MYKLRYLDLNHNKVKKCEPIANFNNRPAGHSELFYYLLQGANHKKNGQEKYNITSLPNIETLCQRDSEVNDVNGQSQHYFEMIKISLALLEHSPDNKCMIMQCKLAVL
jgi:hypothetical protein